MTSTTPDDATPAGGTFDAGKPADVLRAIERAERRPTRDVDTGDILGYCLTAAKGQAIFAAARKSLVALPTAESETGEDTFVKTMRDAIVQARGALQLDVMVDGEGKPYGTTVEAFKALSAAETALARHGAAAAGGAVGDVRSAAMAAGLKASGCGLTVKGQHVFCDDPGASQPTSTCACRDIIEATLAAIPATPTGATQPSPVAGGGEVAGWQWRGVDDVPWHDWERKLEPTRSHAKAAAMTRGFSAYDLRPVYDRPAPHAGEAVGRRDGMLRAASTAPKDGTTFLACTMEDWHVAYYTNWHDNLANEDYVGFRDAHSLEELEIVGWLPLPVPAIRAEVDRPTDTHDARGTSAERGGWQPISTAPLGRDANGVLKQVLLIAKYPDRDIWSDVVHSWWCDDHWARWEHSFRPTHWRPLPPPPGTDSFTDTSADTSTETSAEREGAGRDDGGAAVGVTDAEVEAALSRWGEMKPQPDIGLRAEFDTRGAAKRFLRLLLEAAARARPTPAAGAVTEAVRAEREACVNTANAVAQNFILQGDAGRYQAIGAGCVGTAIMARSNAFVSEERS